jgi:hypothetical protein
VTSSQPKRGFRLPWGSERGPEQDAATLDSADGEVTTGAASDDLGDGPFRPADAAELTTDAAPAAADVPGAAPEAAMMDVDTQHNAAAEGGGWPSTDRRGADRPFAGSAPAPSAGGSGLPRRDNPLVAGLVKAMREAAIASREETSARLQAEASARVEAIKARATGEATGLRKRADDDVSAIREWSKAEVARIKQETDEKIEARKGELAGEIDRHSASVDRLVAEVQTTVTSFEQDMDRFFQRLLAESDPAQLATMAEQAPLPPDLRGDGPAATDFLDEVDAGAAGDETTPGNPAEALHADDAAEAEAEATEGLDPHAVDEWPTVVLAAARRDEPAPVAADANGPDSTRLLVSGLTSVAGISAFKGALSQLAGVRSVSVSSGEKGVFVFAVSHDPGVDLDSGVASLPGFAAAVTDATNDGFTVDAHESAA